MAGEDIFRSLNRRHALESMTHDIIWIYRPAGLPSEQLQSIRVLLLGHEGWSSAVRIRHVQALLHVQDNHILSELGHVYHEQGSPWHELRLGKGKVRCMCLSTGSLLQSRYMNSYCLDWITCFKAITTKSLSDVASRELRDMPSKCRDSASAALSMPKGWPASAPLPRLSLKISKTEISFYR